MKLTVLASRDHAAQQRILAAAERLAAAFDLPEELVQALRVQRGEPPVRAMKQREAVAGLLEALIDKTATSEKPKSGPARARRSRK